MNNNLLTIVTPSYDRPNLLIRSIRFWAKTDFNHLVLDGSQNPTSLKKEFSNFPRLNYVHSNSSFHDRICSISKYVSTKYLVLVADDDLCFPSVFEKCIKFLESNQDYSSCVGRAIGFGINNNGDVYPVGNVYGDMANNYKITDKEPLERLNSHLIRYMPTNMYGIQRRENWDFIIGHYKKQEFPIFSVCELEMEMLTAFCGKTIVFEDLSWLKSVETEQISINEPTFNQNIQADQLWRSENFNKDLRLEYLNSLSKWISDNSDIKLEIVRDKLDQTFYKYSKWVDNYFDNQIRFHKLRNKLKSLIPSFILKKLLSIKRILKNFINEPQKKKDFFKFLMNLEKDGWEINFSEAKIIYKHIRKYNNHKKIFN